MSFLDTIEYIKNPDPYTTVDRNGVSHSFTQLYQHFPQIEFLYTDVEKNFRSDEWTQWTKDTWPVYPLVLITVYGLMIFTVPKYMKNRERFVWKYQMALWNFSLSLFSFMGAMKTVPHLLHNLYQFSFDDNICKNAAETYGHGACGFWVMLFIFSKVPELVDTVFIVFRKAKLEFLHWYHHMTVLAFCWHAFAFESSTGIFFVAMNYSVHAIMYFYFCMTGLKMVPKWFPKSIITMAQISQMIVGTTVCYLSYAKLNSGQECSVTKDNVYAGIAMYGSYLYLFTDFFVRTFIFKTNKKNKDVKEIPVEVQLTKEDKKAIEADGKSTKAY